MIDKQARESLIFRATALLEIARQIDYTKVLQHDRAEVAKLHSLLGELDKEQPRLPAEFSQSELQGQSAPAQQAATEAEGDDAFKAARQLEILEQLANEGFSDRLGRVYNSRSEERSMEFRRVPHRKNLPDFDMIVSADYAPGAGLHGIIINDHHVMSVYLASPEEQNEWQILKRRPYDNMEEMGEYVTLLAAGFDLP